MSLKQTYIKERNSKKGLSYSFLHSFYLEKGGASIDLDTFSKLLNIGGINLDFLYSRLDSEFDLTTVHYSDKGSLGEFIKVV